MRALVGLPPSPTDGEPGKEPASENFLTKYIGLDPVILAVAFTVTTPLVPLEVAATVFLARRIVARMGSKAAGKAL